MSTCYVDSATAPNLSPNASGTCSALNPVGADVCPFPDCKYYNSYAYLQKICLPYDYAAYPSIENNIWNNEGVNVVLSNVATTYTQLLIIGAGVVVLTVAVFLWFLCCPKIMYLYVTITFLGLLFLAFYTMKLSKVREITNTASGFTPIVNSDEQRIQYVSYVIFALFLLTSPLVLFGYRRLNFAIRLCHALRGFYRRMVTMYFFQLAVQILMYAIIGFQVFVGCSILTYGTTSNSQSTSPFNKYTSSLVGVPVYIFELIGTYWLVAVFACLCQFVVACNMHFWYYEETSEMPAFSPLRRSLGKSIYHFGSIALDAILVPITWLLLVIFEALR